MIAACRDVCADGFELEDEADAVFLDLPHPWDAVPHAKRALKKSVDARICSFSPCVEQVKMSPSKQISSLTKLNYILQVQKACEALRKHGFNEISTVECLQRVFQVRKITMPTYDSERNKKKPTIPCDANGDADASESKKRKLEEEEGVGGENPVEVCAPEKPEKTFVTGVPLLTMPGHTGYLTFATLPASLPKNTRGSDQECTAPAAAAAAAQSD